MIKSIQLLKHELSFIESRILMIKQGKGDSSKGDSSKGMSLKDALEFQKDLIQAIQILEEKNKK